MNPSYGQFHALKDLNLTVHKGERIVICGRSGSGKSTLICGINRLQAHQDGSICVLGPALDDKVGPFDLIRREVGMVFPHFNLFAHLTVLENCTLALRLARKLPDQLSGGQPLRVASAHPGPEPRDPAVRRAHLGP